MKTVVSPKTLSIILDKIAQKYLLRAKDINLELIRIKIKVILQLKILQLVKIMTILQLMKKRYRGTQGLQRLLTYTGTVDPNEDLYSEDDLKMIKEYY